LLDNVRIRGAQHLLVNFSYGATEPLMSETRAVKRFLQEEAGHAAHLKMGITQDENLGDSISITVIATGFETSQHNPVAVALQPEVQAAPVVQEAPLAAVQPPAPAPSVPSGSMFTPRAVEQTEDIHVAPAAQAPQAPPVYNGPYGNVASRGSEREKLLDNDLDVPAYLRKGVVLATAPASDARDVSRITIGEESSDVRDMTVRPNRHLHDNVD
jgi:cell division protein FtsZ